MPHMRAVALFDVGVVVPAVAPRALEEHRPGAFLQPRNDVAVDELPAVVAVNSAQREGQARHDVPQLPERGGLVAVLYHPMLGPVGADIHPVQHPSGVVV